MHQPHSEIVGEVELTEEKRRGSAHRALRPVICAGCGLIIPEGTLFVRILIPESGVPISPRCQKCSPFKLLEQTDQTESPLMNNLLRGGEEGEGAAPQPGSAKEAEAVALRLGPALARTRRSGRSKA